MCDVAVADFDADGYDDIVLCQSRAGDFYTTDSLVYRGGMDGVSAEPVRLRTEDPRRVFAAMPDQSRTTTASSDCAALAKHPTGGARPDILFVNRWGRNAVGDVQPSIYFGAADGFSLQRRRGLAGLRYRRVGLL